MRYFITAACPLSSEVFFFNVCTPPGRMSQFVLTYLKKNVLSRSGDVAAETVDVGQVQAPVVLPRQAPDLDKNMLREALLASVNEEAGSGPYCILILYP